MTSYTTITVDLPEPTSIAALEARFRAYITRDTQNELDYLVSGGDGALDFFDLSEKDTKATRLAFWVNTKYALEGSRNVAQAMSGAFPATRVSWSESWDDEEGGENQADFQAGELTAERAAQIVPSNLDALVKELEEALGKRGYERNTAHAVRSAAAALVKAYHA